MPAILGYRVQALDGPAGHLADVLGASATTEGAVSGILVVDLDADADGGGGGSRRRAVPGSRLDDIDIDERLVRLGCRRGEMISAPPVAPGAAEDLGLLLAEVVAHYFPSRRAPLWLDDLDESALESRPGRLGGHSARAETRSPPYPAR